tara:strand:+ start:1128 stop:1697 length:570 start_codon:yes stop_codon:yes gene_type:complete
MVVFIFNIIVQMCDSFICTDDNLNITLNADNIGVGWFICAYIVFRFLEHFLGAFYWQHNRELLQIGPKKRFSASACCPPTGVYRQMWYQFGRSIFAVLSFLLILEKNWVMFVLLIFFDVLFVPIRFLIQKEDKKYTSVKQELYTLFMNIDHDPNDEVYKKLVEYMNKMKGEKLPVVYGTLAKKYRDISF